MGDTPFGFSLPGEPEREPGGGESGGSGPGGSGPGQPTPPDPMAMFGNPQEFADALRQFADLMSWQGGPVNWDLATNVARHTVAAQGDASILAPQSEEIAQALRLADLWLDDVTTFPSGVRASKAWSRSEWVEATLPVWSKLCDPIAAKAVETMSGALTAGEALGAEALGETGDAGDDLRAQLQAMAGPMLGLVRQIGGLVVASQTGQAVGALALEVVSSTDVGLPVGPEGTAALIPANVAAFGSGLSVPEGEVRLFLALREAAHHRLFAHVPWLRAHLFGAVDEYAKGITVDTSQLRQSVMEIDLTNPEALQEAMAGGTFLRPEETPRQKAALARLETALALVEGWVATVVDEAASKRLPGAAALAEAVRRRRATGGPAERTFATLVGLELRPRRLREAAAIWRGLTDERGAAGRDAVWSHPDLLPEPSDFDDPDGFVRGRKELDISALDDAEPPAAERAEGAGGPGGDAADGDASDGHASDGGAADGEADTGGAPGSEPPDKA
ncbi:MAG TPA: zinc-dependent metalloprotease [Streptosporangiaceae bacterium]|nr:zinc-dependent metalloprotease [Streptosporangiaceae bacterium]